MFGLEEMDSVCLKGSTVRLQKHSEGLVVTVSFEDGASSLTELPMESQSALDGISFKKGSGIGLALALAVSNRTKEIIERSIPGFFETVEMNKIMSGLKGAEGNGVEDEATKERRVSRKLNG